MAKEYQTWELVKMWQEGQTGVFKLNLVPSTYLVRLTKEVMLGTTDNFKTSHGFSIDWDDKNNTWTKVNEPVSIQEAMEALQKKEPVYCLYQGLHYEFDYNKNHLIWYRNGYEGSSYIPIGLITEGQWYIGRLE